MLCKGLLDENIISQELFEKRTKQLIELLENNIDTQNNPIMKDNTTKSDSSTTPENFDFQQNNLSLENISMSSELNDIIEFAQDNTHNIRCGFCDALPQKFLSIKRVDRDGTRYRSCCLNCYNPHTDEIIK